MASKPSRAAPPPPIPHHADRNNNKQRNKRQNIVLTNNHQNSMGGKVPTVIRPKMVDTPKKLAPPRPPPPRMDASFIPTRTSSLGRGITPPIPPPPKNKPSLQKGLQLKAKALKKVKIFGKSTRSCTTNANGEFYTASMSSSGFGRSYTNQALSASTKKQAPLPPPISSIRRTEGTAIGTLISFDSPPTSPGIVSRANPLEQNVQSLLDLDFPEANYAGGASLLDMDIPPMLSQSLSVDNFGSPPFDPFAPQQRKASLPITSVSPSVHKLTPQNQQRRISQIREEFSSILTNSPPPPRCPAPQLDQLETSAVMTQPCAMALIDNLSPKRGELAFSQYDLIEIVGEHDDRHFLGRFEESEGLVARENVEVLTPLDDCQQDSEPESQQEPKKTKDDEPKLILRKSLERQSSKPIASVQPFSNVQQNDETEVIAIYDFDAQHDDELSFKAGDKLIVTTRCDQDWYYGYTVQDNQYGIFPSTFVQQENGSETESLKGELKSEIIEQKDGTAVIALYTFAPEQEGDLAFEEGETIIVLSRINKDWLMGRNLKGQEGQFPASFVQTRKASTSSTKETDDVVHIALYDFEAQQEDDLAIRVGDKIQVTEKVTEEWWQGHILGETKEGIFPANFVEPI